VEPYKTTCWVEELYDDLGLDILEKSPVELPWVVCPVNTRLDGSGDEAEGWIIPVPPEQLPKGLPEEVKPQ
jgi:hypothetical protein